MQKIIKKLPYALRQSIIYALALAGSKAVSLILIPIYTYYLEPADYGRLDVIQTLADVLSIVIGLGLADTAFRFCNNDNKKDNAAVIANLYGIAWAIAVISMIITQILAPSIADFLPADITTLQTRLILASLSLSGTILVPMAWLRINGKAKFYLYGSMGRTIFQAFLTCILLFMGFGITGFILAGFIACLTLTIWMAIIQLKDTGITLAFGSIKKYGVYGGPLIFAGFSGFFLGSFDRWILADIVGPAIMAEYALAAKFGLITAVLIQPFDLWWHAKRFQTFRNEGNVKCASIALIGFLVLSSAVIIVSSASPLLITYLTPETYHGAIKYVPWLILLAALHNLTQTLGFGIYLQSNTKFPAIIDGTAAIIALIAYFSLIPKLHIEGAIYATTIALTYRFLITFIVSQRLNFIPYNKIRFGILIIFTLSTSLWIGFAPIGLSQILFGSLAITGLGILALVLHIISIPKFGLKVAT